MISSKYLEIICKYEDIYYGWNYDIFLFQNSNEVKMTQLLVLFVQQEVVFLIIMKHLELNALMDIIKYFWLNRMIKCPENTYSDISGLTYYKNYFIGYSTNLVLVIV